MSTRRRTSPTTGDVTNKFSAALGRRDMVGRGSGEAFQPGLSLKQSIVPGFLTLIGTGKFVAASNDSMVFVEPTVRVDPQALAGWADCPSPCHHYDHQYLRGVLGGVRALTGLGGASGEEHQFEFVGAGRVLLQSTEQLMASWTPARCPVGAGVPGGSPSRPDTHQCPATWGPATSLRTVSGSLRSVISNVCALRGEPGGRAQPSPSSVIQLYR